MSKASKRAGRQAKRVDTALNAVKQGVSICKAVQMCYIHKSTFYRRVTMPSSQVATIGCPSALNAIREAIIVETLRKFAARQYPLSREKLLDAVTLFCFKLPLERQQKLRFKNQRPRVKFGQSFVKSHKLLIRFAKPSYQEGKRYRATNAVNLVSYAADLKEIIEVNNIDDSRIANIDESGFSPDRDRLGSTAQKRYGTKGTPIYRKLVRFKYRNRITLLPTAFADGSTGPPFWGFKGTNIP